MATSGRRIDEETRNQIVRLLEVRCPRRYIAQLCHVSKRTVDKIASEEEERRAAERREAAYDETRCGLDGDGQQTEPRFALLVGLPVHAFVNVETCQPSAAAGVGIDADGMAEVARSP